MEEITGMLASAVGKKVASKLGELVSEEVNLQWRFKDDVEDMAEKMKDLEAVLHDADDRSRRRGSDGQVVGRWLTKFKSVAYDVEDVLDELEAAELIKESKPKLNLFFSWNNQLLRRITIAHNMKNIREKAKNIEKEGVQTLNLVPREVQAEGTGINETFATINYEGMKTGMVGRDTEKEKIISLLLKSEGTEDISIIPIVGLGGIGKSTLAQSVIADKRANVFDIQAWVHVSKEFDLHKIGSAIMKSINSCVNLNNYTLHVLQESLRKELATRRYLIVLDDLWEEDGNKLENLKQILQDGCIGSRIIITTRNQSVVKKLQTGFLASKRKICPIAETEQINLGILSGDDCWKMMKQRVLGPDDDQNGLEEIGMQIADKCGGLPLVVNSIAHVMSELRTVKAWEDIRDTKIDLGSRDQKDTLESLMLSYYYMKLEFKMCFTYLAVFPKGYIMNSNHLIQQWIALGYIHGYDDGKRCINYLLGMSFLEKSRFPLVLHMNGMVSQDLSMHDLVHDLTLVTTANEFIVLDGTDPRTWYKTRYCRHAQLINYQNQIKVFKDLPTKIRSLHFRDSGKVQLPLKAFSRSKYTRVLDLSGCSVEGQSTPSKVLLPSSVQHLKLLRYLDATGLPIRSLPSSFHTLRNMQTLILSKCSLATLPENICSLDRLRYMDLSGNSSLTKLPTSLGKLPKLSFLNISGCSLLQELPEAISELTCLSHIDLSESHALQRLPDKFGSLRQLVFLNLSGCSKLTKLPDTIDLQSLEYLNLSSCHELQTLPEDFGNISKLYFLNLSGCYKIVVLPESFCQLVHLKELDVSDNHNLIELPRCFGNLCQLESFNLTSCPKLQRLPESFCKLTNLKHLNLSYCISLGKLPSSFSELKLQTLDASHSLHDLPDSIGDMTSLTKLVVTSGITCVMEKAEDIRKHLNLSRAKTHIAHQIHNRGCSSIVDIGQLACRELTIAHLETVKHAEDGERAKLRDKSDLQRLVLHWGIFSLVSQIFGSGAPEMMKDDEEAKFVLERLIPPRALEHFSLEGYMSKEFPSWMSHICSYLPCLTYLMLCDLGKCEYLPPFGQLPNLRSIYMHNMPNIRVIGKEFYGEGGPCKKLRVIQLKSMEKLTEWWTTESGKQDEEFLIPNLHELDVTDCPNLKFLPYPPRSMRWYLENSDEVLPELGFGMLTCSILPISMGIENCKFSPNKWDRLQHLPTLERLEITSCSVSGFLTDAIRCFASLKSLHLISLNDLETLPEWLGQLTCLEAVIIHDCRKLTFLPESMKNLAKLKLLDLLGCQGLDSLPEWLGHLTSLEHLCIKDSCSQLTCLPGSMKNLVALRLLFVRGCKGLETLPEWLGQLSFLKEFCVDGSPRVTCLPESIRNLTELTHLYIADCPILTKRCYGEDAYKISHIPTVMLNTKRFRGGIGEPSMGLSCVISPRRPRNGLVLKVDSFTRPHHDRS